MKLRIAFAAIAACGVLAAPAAANHSFTTGTGQALHQVSNAGTSSDRTINVLENIQNPSATPGLLVYSWLRNYAEPEWTASPLLNFVAATGSQPFGTCTMPSGGDVRLCDGYSLTDYAALTYYSFTSAGHITGAYILIDDYLAGFSHWSDTCYFPNTLDEATGDVRPATTQCYWYARATLAHELGHTLGLAHPNVGYLYYGPMGAGYLWQSTEGCSYDTPPPGTGHACDYPEAHDFAQVAYAGGHVDSSGPSPGSASASRSAAAPHPDGTEMRDLPIKNLPRDGKWHKINRDGGAIRRKDMMYTAVRLHADGGGDFMETMPPVIRK